MNIVAIIPARAGSKRLKKKNRLKINYLTASPEKLNEIEKYDVILNLEIIEHVEDVSL